MTLPEVTISPELHADRRLSGDAKICYSFMKQQGLNPESVDYVTLGYLYGVHPATVKNWVAAACRVGYWFGYKKVKRHIEKKPITEPIYPDWANEECRNEIDTFYEHRLKVKHPVTTQGTAKRIAADLARLSGSDNDKAIKILRQSIDSGKWYGLYELRGDKEEYWNV